MEMKYYQPQLSYLVAAGWYSGRFSLIEHIISSPTPFGGDLSASCSHKFNIAHLEDSWQ